MTLVPGCARRITSEMASGGLGDNPASKRMISAGVLGHCGESLLQRFGLGDDLQVLLQSENLSHAYAKNRLRVGHDDSNPDLFGFRGAGVSGGTGSKRRIDPRRDCGIGAPRRSGPFKLVLVDDNGYAPSGGFFRTSNHAALALDQHIAVRSQNISWHGDGEFDR